MPEPEFVPLTPEQKAKRAASFGDAAAHYERYRPGPPVEAVEWVLPHRCGRPWTWGPEPVP